MKIGLVCPYNLFRGGGVQEVVLALQRELRSRGHDAKIITPLPRDKNGHTLPDTIFVGVAADFKSPFHTTAQVSVSLDNDALSEVLEHEKFDILHFHEPWVPIVSRQILGKSTSINIATFHAKLPETIMSRTIEKVITPYTRTILRDLHALTAVSTAAAEYVGSMTDQHVEIIPNGIDLRAYSPTKASKRTPYILYIGRLEKRKGITYLLHAFAKLTERDSEVELIIAGDGPDREKLEAQVLEHNIPRVTFLGFVSHKEKVKLFSQARLFVSPAVYGESFGIVLLEAMAMGVPVVAGDNPGYASVLRDAGELSLVDPRDTREFERRLNVMLCNDELRDIWKRWAKEHISQFAYSKIVDKYEALYQRLMEQNR